MGHRRNRFGTALFGVLAMMGAGSGPLRADEPPVVVQAPDPGPAPPSEGAPPAAVTLEEAIAAALQGNFDLLSGQDRLQEAGLHEGVARAQFRPQVTPRYQRDSVQSAVSLEGSQRVPWTGATLAASASLRHVEDVLGPFSHGANLQASLTQPVLRGFGEQSATYDLVNARRARQAQERQLELDRQRLAVRVAATFYEVVQQRQLVEVAAQSLERSRALQRSSEARLEVGLASKLDVYRAQLQASQGADAELRARASLQSALEQFRSLLGLSPSAPLEPAAVDLAGLRTDEPEPVEALVARALATRLDLAEARDQIADARRTESVARQNLLPQLDLALSVSQIGLAPTYDAALRTAETRFAVGLVTAYPLNRTADQASAATASLERSARERNLRQRELEVEAEVRAAVRELARLRQSLELQRQSVEVSEQQRRLAELRYERGLASNFDVVDAESSLVLARTAMAGLQASWQVARLDLERVLGTLRLPGEAP